MANPNYQAGGSFLPGYPSRITSTDPWNFDVLPTAGTDTGQGAQTILSSKLTSQDVIATGATGSTAAVVSTPMPVLVNANATGVSGAGINLPTGTLGQLAIISNNMTGVLKIYAVGATINGTTGTTAYSLTATGNKMAIATCTVAGAWNVFGNT